MGFDISEEAITAVVDDIWQAMLGLTLVPDAPTDLDGSTLTGCVHISGEWSGSVTLEVRPEMARRGAALMFGMEEGDLSQAELEDALGELTNMTGGGVKAMVAGSCQLSLPTVVGGREYTVTIPGSRVVHTMWYSCDGDAVVVKVFERGEARDEHAGLEERCAS